jgi:hypothetical protein
MGIKTPGTRVRVISDWSELRYMAGKVVKFIDWDVIVVQLDACPDLEMGFSYKELDLER